jgi:hypothetical protein
MRDDPFAGPKLKLVRAKKNRDDFEAERDRFIDEQKWSHVTETSADGSHKEFKIRFESPFPDSFSALISYATQDLRACLDGAACAAAICSGKAGSNAPFPFGESSKGLENCIKGRVKHVPSDILTVIRGFKPYKTGDSLLWAINHVANLDKHSNFVIPMAAGMSPVVFTGMLPKSAGATVGTTPTIPVFLPSNPIWRPENNEIVYVVPSTSIDSKVHADYNIHIMVDIAFGEVEVVGGKPAIGVLNYMIRKVESILLAIEAETRRLFPGAF